MLVKGAPSDVCMYVSMNRVPTGVSELVVSAIRHLRRPCAMCNENVFFL